MNTTPFVILCLPRTGSKLLVEMLDSHPEVLAHTEIFNPKSTYLSRKPHLEIGTREYRDAHPFRFLDRVFAESDGHKIVGFKIMPNHRNIVLLKLVLDRRIRKVILTRRNWLETFVSNQIAHQTKQYHVQKSQNVGSQDAKRSEVHIDPARFRTYMRKVRLFYRVIRLLHRVTLQDPFEIDYADIKDPVIVRNLLNYLGADASFPLEERLIKQNPGQLADKVSNYEELAANLQGSEYSAFLDPTPDG